MSTWIRPKFASSTGKGRRSLSFPTYCITELDLYVLLNVYMDQTDTWQFNRERELYKRVFTALGKSYDWASSRILNINAEKSEVCQFNGEQKLYRMVFRSFGISYNQAGVLKVDINKTETWKFKRKRTLCRRVSRELRISYGRDLNVNPDHTDICQLYSEWKLCRRVSRALGISCDFQRSRILNVNSDKTENSQEKRKRKVVVNTTHRLIMDFEPKDDPLT